ncbi:DNA-processing protein DprA [Pollutimonas harenae]|uniref:DNA-protecting protein DprA n=1 Tax=Pollutimonas harenae TaxID=657015 RepID=A0A853H458_9BURK|nr:DNA-processing protein DprA [Pollutimonas harenae]NYT84914.1 DNA-protecting protein DprA [Pollutimonas harenae]TEA72691.1 DNA-protecting protein DprA [Pollutimonas harenae]
MPIIFPKEELSSWIRLSLEPGLGPAQARHLLATLGLPQDIYAAASGHLAKLLPSKLVQQLKQEPSNDIQTAIANTLAWLEHPQHHLLTLADPAYPCSLLDIHDPPLLLYANGNPDYLNRQAISIVGARSASDAGTDNARAFAQHLAEQGWCIVSGLAMGIDAAAHEGALRAGPNGGGTVAIMGTGIDIVYPARNRELAHRIAQDGLLISEFPLGTRAIHYQFPKRNRLVAGMARGVLVVEAAKQSGSLITARLASEMGREVFAIPGSIHSPLSRGCHALIRQGAKLVESAEDIHEELGHPNLMPDRLTANPNPATAATASKQPEAPAAPAIRLILEAMGYDPVDLDTLQKRTQLSLSVLNSSLLTLELSDTIGRQADGRFLRRSTLHSR